MCVYNNIEIYNPPPPPSPAADVVWPPRQCAVTLRRSCRWSPLLLAPYIIRTLFAMTTEMTMYLCRPNFVMPSLPTVTASRWGWWCTPLRRRDGRSTLGTVHEHARDQHPVDEPLTRRHSAGQPRAPHLLSIIKRNKCRKTL